MSQEITNRKSRQTINAPFRVKSAGVSLVTILVIGMYYVANLISLLPSDEPVPEGALNLVITALVLIIAVESALQIVLFIGAGRTEDRTGRDEAIASRASRNAYFVMIVGVFATFGSMFIGFTPFEMGSLLLLAFLLAEIVKFASQIVYYQRTG
jgi:MFS family permease